MKKYEISHIDGDGKTFLIEAETAGKAKMKDYRAWNDACGGTFKDYLEGLIYCRRVKANNHEKSIR